MQIMKRGKKRLLIFGTGGNCIDILDIINDINDSQPAPIYECVGLLDDNRQKWGQDIQGVKVLGPLQSAGEYQDCFFVNGIGSPVNFWRKEEIIAQAALPLERFETLIHPTANVSKMSKIGQGTVIFQHVTVNSNVDIGYQVIILPNSIISHDNRVGNYTCITGGVCISGGVEIGQSCYLGANSTIIHNIKIGQYCLIGMGSVVLTDVPDNIVVAGNPAKVLRKTFTTGPRSSTS